MPASSAHRARHIAAQALFDPAALAATLASSLSLADGAPRLLLAAPTPASLAALAEAVHQKVPDAALTLAAPTAVAANELRALLTASPAGPATVAETALDALEAAFEAASFDAIALPGDLFPPLLHANDDPDDDPDVAQPCDAPTRDEVNAALATVVRVLHAAKTVLVARGRLYVDCVAAGVATAQRRAVPVSLGADGTVTADVTWAFAQDDAAYTRTATIDVAVRGGGAALRAVEVGVLASYEQLRSAASYAGFTSLDAAGPATDGAVLQGYVARVSGEAAYYDRALSWYRKVWNGNGMINWGLFNAGFPAPSYDPDVRALATVSGDADGALVGANRAFNTWVRAKVDAALGASGKTVRSVLDVGCGTGRPTIELAKRYRATLDYALGVDPGALNIAQACAFAAAEKESTGLEVEFFHGVMEDAVDETRTFDLAWTESALAHATDDGRRASLQAIGRRVAPGGIFMCNDWFRGFHPLSPRAKLHLFERLHVPGAWSLEQYVYELRVAGFRLVEYVDLTEQKAASYAALSKAAARCAAEAETGSSDEFMLRCLELDYRYSSIAAGNGESTWAMLLCRRE